MTIGFPDLLGLKNMNSHRSYKIDQSQDRSNQNSTQCLQSTSLAVAMKYILREGSQLSLTFLEQ